jgi:hypothetical protein
MSLSPPSSLPSLLLDLKEMSVYSPFVVLNNRVYNILLSYSSSQIGKVRQASPSICSSICSNAASPLTTFTDSRFKYFFLGAYIMLLYDHLLTLPSEVRHFLLTFMLASMPIPWYSVIGSDSVEEEENVP